MTPEEDRFWRIIIGAALVVTIAAFRPQIMKWLQSIGYRDWREKPDKKEPPETR